MERLVKVVSIDEEFQKGRGKDLRPRKKRSLNKYWSNVPHLKRPEPEPGDRKSAGATPEEQKLNERDTARAKRYTAFKAASRKRQREIVNQYLGENPFHMMKSRTIGAKDKMPRKAYHRGNAFVEQYKRSKRLLDWKKNARKI
jgi:hypothetical protein